MRYGLVALAHHRPGICIRDAARRLRVAPSTVLYHVEVLLRHAMVAVREERHRMALFPASATSIEVELGAAAHQGAKGDLLAVLAEGPLHMAEAARRIGKDRSTVKRHADGLRSRGLVIVSEEGPARVLRLAPGVVEAFAAAGRARPGVAPAPGEALTS